MTNRAGFPNHEYHPAAGIFPMLDGAEYDSLKADIAANGLRESIWLYEGRIIDGRNRYRACRELNLTPPVRTWDGNGSLIAFVVSLNLHRRHLTASQRAAAGAEIEPMLAAEAKRRMQAAGGDRKSKNAKKSPVAKLPQAIPDAQSRVAESVSHPTAPAAPGRAREQAATITGSSPRNVSEAKAIKKESPATFERVKRGELTLSKARQQVESEKARAGLPPTKTAEQEATDSAARRFATGMHNLHALFGGVRDAGGIDTLTRLWSADQRRDYAEQLGAMRDELGRWNKSLTATLQG